MKVHVGASKQGLVHSIVTGPANEADITKLDGLLHGAENELYGDQAYWSEDHRQHCKHAGIRYRVNRRPKTQYHPLTEYQRTINRARSRCRARGEHAFHVVKRCGALLWFVIAAWPRTPCGPSRCLHWLTCTWRDDDCCLAGRNSPCNRRLTERLFRIHHRDGLHAPNRSPHFHHDQ